MNGTDVGDTSPIVCESSAWISGVGQSSYSVWSEQPRTSMRFSGTVSSVIFKSLSLCNWQCKFLYRRHRCSHYCFSVSRNPEEAGDTLQGPLGALRAKERGSQFSFPLISMVLRFSYFYRKKTPTFPTLSFYPPRQCRILASPASIKLLFDVIFAHFDIILTGDVYRSGLPDRAAGL